MAKKWAPDAIRLLNLGPTASWRTQAVYHATAEMMTADSRDTIILCQPLTPYLCLGYQQIFDSVLDRAECERQNWPVVRRYLGGGTTYLDANQLLFQCVFHHSRLPAVMDDLYALVLAAPVNALKRLGLNARLRAMKEIAVDGQRIAHISGGRIGEATVIVGSLLFDFDYNALAQAWRVPDEVFRDLASAAMRDRMTTIWRKSGPVNPEQVLWILLDELAKVLGRPIERGTPQQAETRHSQQVAERITSAEYLNLHGDVYENKVIPPMKSLKIAAGLYIRAAEAVHEGTPVYGSFRVREDVIEEARLRSEPARDWQAVEAGLCGVAFSDWKDVLAKGGG